MLTRYTHNTLTWIDLEGPTGEEVRDLMEEYAINPLVAEELLSPTLRPKVDTYDNCIYLILHFPAFKHTHRSGTEQEVDFVLGKNFIITAHYDTVDPLHKFSKVFEVNSILDKSDIGTHAGFLFFYMAKKLYKSVAHELEFLNDALKDIEANMFAGREKEMVIEISKVSKELLNFKRTLETHRPILSSLEEAGKQFFGPSFAYHLQAITGEFYRVYNGIESNLDMVSELRETNNSLVSTKQNEIMKVLTIMAFVTFPLSLIATIFGMNTEVLPIVGLPNDFWIVMGIMGIATVCFFAFFKHQKWL